MLEINDEIIQDKAYHKEKLDKVCLKDTKIIGVDAFQSSTISQIDFSDTLLQISASAFFNCRNLREIALPDKIKKIYNTTFAYCAKLFEVDLNNTEIIETAAFKECNQLRNIDLSKVETIGSSAFVGTDIRNANLKNIKFIEQSAFQSTPIASLYIGKNCKIIERHAFASCHKLKDIKIEEGLEVIDTYAFSSCLSLEEITLPASLKQIKPYAFLDCKNLKNIYFSGSRKQWKKIAPKPLMVDYDSQLKVHTILTIDDMLEDKKKLKDINKALKDKSLKDIKLGR